MSTIGLISMLLAFVAAALSVITLAVGHALRKSDMGESLSWGGRLAAVIAFAALTVACGVLVVCFLTNNCQIQYVLDNHVTTTGALGTLYRVSGLWAGREGSLLFWAWLISLFGTIVSVRRMGATEELDNIATLVIQLVLVAFVGIMLFSEDNMPFIVTDESYLEDDGTLTTAASLLGMNSLLQHWAMAIHPPMLFIGYAGLTVPFAYAIAAVVANNPSREWVLRSERYALASWLFLSIGIGLGSIWAYVVLGWGGYWGWDPVENASLLAWLVCVALIHSFTLYKNRSMFKGWAVMCACLSFCFCIVGTFISRSGLVQSVHAFEGDPVSLALFGSLIVLSIAAGLIGCLVRRKSFAADAQSGEFGSMVSREGAYYLNNLLMVVLSILLAYLTISEALPGFLPFGGESVSSGTYNAIARPIGVVYLLMMAACPMLAWGKTRPAVFAKKAKAPALLALVLFVVLVVYFALYLVPTYDAIVAAGGSSAEDVLSQGPKAYYFALTVIAFLTASLLFFNSLFQLGRAIKGASSIWTRMSSIGSAVSHTAMAIILVGLVGSSMYVTEVGGYMAYDEETDSCSETFQIRDYELTFVESSVYRAENGNDIIYEITLDVTKEGQDMGQVKPSVKLVASTMQQQSNAATISLPGEDLFVVYQGFSDDETSLSLDVRVNPLISVVWVGFIVLCIGMLLAMIGWRRPQRKSMTHSGKTLADIAAQEQGAKKTPLAEIAEQAKEEA